MSSNIAITYVNIILFIIFVIILGQPENVVLIHVCMIITGCIVGNSMYKKELATYGTFVLYDLYVHWLPGIMSIALVDSKKIGIRQFMFAAIYPLLYLSIRFHKMNNGWNNIVVENPVEHMRKMYPKTNVIIPILLYYVTLYCVYISRGQLGIKM
tara:strand:- start:4782 stop:5246 length:465 start_codon:yes stop_codon:yes gene_type:complete